jgi:DNA-binding transcriptional MocR family regulator
MGSIMPSIVIAPRAPRGPYETIAAALHDQIKSGRLAPGAQLPTTQELATAHSVSTATVHRAFEMLQADGLIEVSRGGSRAGAGLTRSRTVVRLRPQPCRRCGPWSSAGSQRHVSPAFLAPGARPPTRRPGPATPVQELAGGLQDVGESDRRAADLLGPRLKRPERVLLPFICSVGQPAVPSRPA